MRAEPDTPPGLDKSFSLGLVSSLSGQVAGVLLSLPAGIVLARVLGPDGKGAVDLALLVPTLVVLLCGFGLTGATSYLVGSAKHPRQDVISNVVGMWLLLSLIVTPAYWLVAGRGLFAFAAPGVERTLLLVAGILIPLTMGRQLLNAVLLGQLKFIAFNGTQIIYGATRLLGVLILVWLLARGALGGVLAVIGAQLFCVGYLSFMLRSEWRGRPRLSRGIVRDALAYGVRGQAGNLVQFFNYRVDLILLAHFRDLSEVGFYAVAVTLAELLWYVPNASSIAIFPKTAVNSMEARKLTPLAFRVTSVFVILGASALALASSQVVRLLYGGTFETSIAPLRFLLPGVVFLGAAKVLSADLNGRGMPGINAIGATISLFVTIVLDLVLMPRYGAVGAAIASSLAYASTFVYTTIVYSRVAELEIMALFRLTTRDLREVRQTIGKWISRGQR